MLEANVHLEQNSKLCDIMIVVRWQDWRDIRQKTAVDMNEGCHDIGPRKQCLGYHNCWDFWCFIWLVWFCVLHCVDVGSAY